MDLEQPIIIFSSQMANAYMTLSSEVIPTPLSALQVQEYFSV
jgi:hypothetical protein